MMKSLLKKFGRAAGKVLPSGLFLYAKKIYYARELRNLSDTGELDFAVIKHMVKPSDVVVDIGANVGDYTKFLSGLVGQDGMVFSFEPVPSTYEILDFSVRRLKLINVQSYNLAISSREGAVTMEIPIRPDGIQTHYLARIVTGGAAGNCIQVNAEARQLDTMLASVLGAVAFVKCDVEGHELSVIQSARQLIAQSMPPWLIELSSDPDLSDSDSAQAMRTLRESGYQSYWYDGESLRMRKAGDRSVNYFFLTEKHIADIRSKINLVTT